MIDYCEHQSPLGALLLAATEQGLCGVYFEEHKHFKGKQNWRQQPCNPHLQQAAQQLTEYFAGKRNTFELALDMGGTPFQSAVWHALSEIRFGETRTYTEHAKLCGNEHAVRAVGTAIGRNPLSIIVPCHRVIASSGALTGYAGGLERKRFLLAHEGRL
jgi:methylated-DNA-[protein]-cysteine S-methyltransferase